MATENRAITRVILDPTIPLLLNACKHVLVHDAFSQENNGYLIVRFNDFRPISGNVEDMIMEDLEQLGVRIGRKTHVSDYFPQIVQTVERVILEGHAYLDMGQDDDRAITPPEVLRLFKEMLAGKQTGCALKMREGDMVLYTCCDSGHSRTGKSYHAYPTEELANMCVDDIEGMSDVFKMDHSLVLQEVLGLRHCNVQIHEPLVFSEMNSNEVLELGFPWNDPRMPTVKGLMRYKIDVDVFRQFVLGHDGLVNWTEFWGSFDWPALNWSSVMDGVSAVVINGPEGLCGEIIDHRIVMLSRDIVVENMAFELDQVLMLDGWGQVKVVSVEPLSFELTGGSDGDVVTWVTNLDPFVAYVHQYHDMDVVIQPVQMEIAARCFQRGQIVELSGLGKCVVDWPHLNERLPMRLFKIPSTSSA